MKSLLQKLFKKKRNSVKMIAAIDLKNGIGKDGNLIFSLREDMKHFTEKTTGGVVIMGSTTYESIPKKFRPLKNRINIVLNRHTKKYPGEDIIVAQGIESSIRKAKRYKKNIWVIGGASVYEQMLPFTDELEITQIFSEKNADAFFPEFKDDFELISKSERKRDKKTRIEFQFQTWKRKQQQKNA